MVYCMSSIPQESCLFKMKNNLIDLSIISTYAFIWTHTHFEDIFKQSSISRAQKLLGRPIKHLRVPAILSHRSLLMTQPGTGSAAHFSGHEAQGQRPRLKDWLCICNVTLNIINTSEFYFLICKIRLVILSPKEIIKIIKIANNYRVLIMSQSQGKSFI